MNISAKELIGEIIGGKPQYDYPDHYNQPSDCSLSFLQHHINWLVKMPDLLIKDCNTLEIGALYGGASMFILDNYVKKSGHHTIIDSSTNQYIQDNLKPYKDKYTYIIDESQNAVRTLPRDHFDLVYINGNQNSKNVLEDAVNSFYVTKEGGYIVFNNFYGDCPRSAIYPFMLVYGNLIETKSSGFQVIIQKKKK